MKIEREIIVDLLPAYFSGESSAATRALVEEYFRENPDFEKSARSAGGVLDSLKVLAPRLDPEKERLTLERARLVVETRSTFLWMAILFTLLPGVFHIRDHKMVWVLWEGSAVRGIILSVTALFLWFMYFQTRRRKDPVPLRIRFLWVACFYSVLPFLFTFQDHKMVWLFNSEPDVAYIMGAVGLIQWGLFFYHTWKARRTDS
jgi:hypothetical protein